MVEEVCSVCFSPNVTTENGVLVCTVCGTQSQAFAEEEQEYEGALQNSRHRRTVRFKAPKRVAVEVEEAPTGDSQVKAYCLCLQETLLVSLSASLTVCLVTLFLQQRVFGGGVFETSSVSRAGP